MHKLGEQWIEVIDGVEHMVKAVNGDENCGSVETVWYNCPFRERDYDGWCCKKTGENCHTKRWVLEDIQIGIEHEDNLVSNITKCPVGLGLIIKDLGILNADGCLPEAITGFYPILSKHFIEGKFRWMLYAFTVDGMISTTVWGDTLQEAKDAWNRRAG